MSESGVEDQVSEPRFTFRRWEPFPYDQPEIDWDEEIPRLDGLFQNLYKTEDADEKVNIILEAMDPFLVWGDENWAARPWMEGEIRQIFQEISSFPSDPDVSPKRYIRNPDYDQSESNDEAGYPKICSHNGECMCWFDATEDAGIPEFPGGSRYRKQFIDYAHSFLSELLMRLAEWTNYKDDLFWDENEEQPHAMATNHQLEIIDEVLRLAGGVSDFGLWEPDSDSDDDEDLTDDRADYLWAHGNLMRMARGEQLFWSPDVVAGDYESGMEEEDEDENVEERADTDYTGNAEHYIDSLDETKREALGYEYYKIPADEVDDHLKEFWKLLGTLGCRLLGLTICQRGKARLFFKREPVKVWKFSAMVRELGEVRLVEQDNELLSRGRGIKIDQPCYPTRVINTETYEFESDSIAFKSKYAILSHMWGAGEVDYDSAPSVLGTMKEQQLHLKIAEKQKEIEENEDCIKLQSDMRLLQDELQGTVEAREKREKKEAAQAALEGHQPRAKPPPTRPGVNAPTRSPGEKKLLAAIQTAREHGFRYLWSDTICINKKDAGELTENISSMGDYYKNAHTCLLYLDDIDKPDDVTSRGEDNNTKEPTPLSKVTSTKWATRGWTLQECIMCSRVKVFNHKWQEIFSSDRHPRQQHAKLYKRIGQAFHVPPQLLWIGKQPDVAAQFILSLAYARETTRPEDRAYSLMGLLGVKMDVKYGEGAEKACLRLLENVVKSTNDVSVFNWSGLRSGNKNPGRSLFPIDFSRYLTEKERQLWQNMPVLPKQLRAPSEVTVGASGVHGRYEIWSPNIFFEGGNQNAYDALIRYEEILQEASAEEWAISQLDFEIRCTLDVPELDDDDDIKIVAHCSRASLRAQLEFELGITDTAPSRWVLARFAAVQGAEWFLCQLNFGEREIMRKGWFTGMFDRPEEENGDRKRDNSLAYAYLESRGFQAIRIPTDNFDKAMKDVPEEDTWMANLWVG